MGSSEQLHSFIEPPTRPIKRARSPTTFIHSPVKRRNIVIQPKPFISPPRRLHKPLPPDFIAPNDPVITIKRRSRRRVQCRNPPKPRISKEACPESAWHHSIDFGDGGGSESWSPVKARDNIDWSISNCDIEELKSNVLPLYWELLLESLNSIVRVTERLYILQDWNYKGQLKVKFSFQV